MRYITRNEMVEIRLALRLKDKVMKKHPQRKCINSVGVFFYMLDKFF